MEFSYQAKTQSGEVLEGKIEAPNENAAVEILHGKGFMVFSLEPVQRGFLLSDLNQIFAKPKTKDVVIFTRQLSTLVEADMPLAESLRTLAHQVGKASFRKIIDDVANAVEGGSALSAALAEYPKLFSPFYIKLVRSGEVSGKLQDSLSYLADYLERSQGISSKIRGALAYPIFVVGAMIVVMIIMAVYVLPNLLVIFKESGVTELPLPTRMLIGFTDFMNAYLWYLLAVAAGGTALFWRYIHTERGRALFDDIKLRVPIFGKILKNLYLARISESLATLIKADISILDAIKITSDLVGNISYQQILLEAEESVRGGGSISDVFSKYSDMPALLTSMVSVGERTGKLEYMLNHVSKFFKEESESDIQNFAQLLEPVLVLIIGVGVALLVAAVLLPLYSIVNTA